MATNESSLWRAMSLSEREREYSPSSCIGGNYLPFVAAYKTRSRQARLHCAALAASWHRLRYGAKSSHGIELRVPNISGPRRDFNGSACQIRAAVLVSGVYELEPLVGTGINTALGLDAASARGLSPAMLALASFPQTLVAWGAVETQEFKRQSQAFARDLAAAGNLVETLEVPQRNHFDVILELACASTSLGAHTLAYLNSD